ncbi:hypothetical protein L6R52_20215 [Myxococcota bacterium]|nr:hypothetical protein [Myxococcota bacterium]
MLWDELDLERFPQKSDLAKAAAKVFRVAISEIGVADDLAKAPELPVRLEVRKTGGDFPWRLGIYLTKVVAGTDRLGAARALSAALGTRLLRGGADPNPYARELVDPAGTVKKVALDVATLDERGWPKLDEAASERVAAKHRDDQLARFKHLWAIFQDVDVGVPVTTDAQAKAITALTASLSRVMHAGAPTPEEKAAVDSAARATRAAFAPQHVKGPNGLSGLLEACDIVRAGGLD